MKKNHSSAWENLSTILKIRVGKIKMSDEIKFCLEGVKNEKLDENE